MPVISACVYRLCTAPLIAYSPGCSGTRPITKSDCPDAEDYALSFLSLIGAPSRVLSWGMELDATAIDKRIDHTVELFLNGLTHRRV